MRSSSVCILVLIWAYSQVAQAYTKFEPECTNPEGVVNFVASPPTRGTLDILWSSLFTIFACTWTILHLNVPQQRDGQDPGTLGDLKWATKAIWYKGKWMLVAVIAPEVILFYALERLVSARKQHPRIKKLADADQVPWTLTHTTFTIMGGFVVRGGSDRVGKGFTPESPTTQTQSPAAKEWYILDIDTILELRSGGHIVLPCIPEAEIDDHSKGDLLTKGIAAIQILWAIATAITRAHLGLAISVLEISVLAFAACALLIYAVYWSSPKDVSVPITFLQWPGAIPSPVMDIILGPNPCHNSTSFQTKRKQKATSNLDQNNEAGLVSNSSVLFVPLIFGAPHLLAWNFTFPTSAEGILWRTTSIYCSLVGLIFYICQETHNIVLSLRLSGRVLTLLEDISFGVFLVVYILARLFMIVETFRTLLFLPPSAYIATWTSSAPMFG
ncbi:hypothetical protein V493_03307 [Pseudogymnoascus sp. VKM F-4281 (FW-2241)]|nr:hypothetical protein V493_03307 [Pseudogymnoascus sp. VKM F-4281 (FW-2241)]